MTGTLTYKTDDAAQYCLGGVIEYIVGEIVFELVSCLFEVL
jgi:hypothetical protein